MRVHADRRICASLLLQQFNYYQPWYDLAWILFWFGWLCYTVSATGGGVVVGRTALASTTRPHPAVLCSTGKG